MRDRLIEFINYSRDFRKTCSKWGSNEPCKGCKYDLGAECDLNGRIADHLLANGVIVPPCMVNQKVWVLWGTIPKVYQVNVYALRMDTKKNDMRMCVEGVFKVEYCGGWYNHYYKATFKWSSIGKAVFLTKAEAEKALAEREGKG